MSQIIGIIQLSSEVPADLSLKQNFPNPFNPLTKIRYEITGSEFVKLSVFDIGGRLVQTLVNAVQTPGTYEVDFEAAGLNSGVYFYRLETPARSETRKMTLIK
jgi:hypothetical protein